MNFGAHPDAPVKEWEEDSPRVRKVNPTFALAKYFLYHPKTKMTQRFSEQDRAILGRKIKSMQSKGYTEDDIKTAINRFFATPWGAAERPVLPFCNNNFQLQLTHGFQVESKGDIDRFISDGFSRSDDMKLPWDESFDDLVKRRVLRDPDQLDEIVKEVALL